MENKCMICEIENKVLPMDGFSGPIKCNDCLDIRLKKFYENKIYIKVIKFLKERSEKCLDNCDIANILIIDDLIGEIQEMKNENN